MNDYYRLEAKRALNNAQKALQEGNRRETHLWASQAARLAPDLEAPWLILAAISAPSASVYYLKRALEVNPQSERARQGMHWAIRRQRMEQTAPVALHQTPVKAFSEENTRRVLLAGSKKQALPPKKYNWLATLPVLFLGLLACTVVFLLIAFPSSWPVLAQAPYATRPTDALIKPSLTPTATFTPTPTFTPTATFTPTPTATETPLPTATATETPLPPPADTPIPEVITNYQPNNSAPSAPEYSGGNGERWIDINLSSQMLYAYEGNQVVASFLVSTGTWEHPTVTGQFNIYVKYLYTDMSGPGYYLPDVPYTMYFYSGYGIHGTYWHSNFGTPMSHGCVNMATGDAGWIYDWASVGTLVNIHY